MADKKLIGVTFYEDLKAEDTKLKNQACSFVILHAPTVLRDSSNTRIEPDETGSYKNLGKEIVWGFGTAINQLFLTESTPMIPVKNLNQISVRGANPSPGQIVAYTFFVEE